MGRDGVVLKQGTKRKGRGGQGGKNVMRGGREEQSETGKWYKGVRLRGSRGNENQCIYFHRRPRMGPYLHSDQRNANFPG